MPLLALLALALVLAGCGGSGAAEPATRAVALPGGAGKAQVLAADVTPADGALFIQTDRLAEDRQVRRSTDGARWTTAFALD